MTNQANEKDSPVVVKEAAAAPRVCECPWPGDELCPEVPCGCGQEQARLYRDTVWDWKGGHWRSECLIAALSTEAAQLRQVLERVVNCGLTEMCPDCERLVDAALAERTP